MGTLMATPLRSAVRRERLLTPPYTPSLNPRWKAAQSIYLKIWQPVA